jgi:O-antigen/teichoic acid export membrane protein/polysaccharide pyruvyl transferase WcaK-like protein
VSGCHYPAPESTESTRSPRRGRRWVPQAAGDGCCGRLLGLVVRSILRTFGFLIGGRVAGDLFTFVLFVAVSRRFGQEGVGQYSFAVALTGFAIVVSDFGLYPFTLKELSRSPVPEDRYGGIVSARLFLSLVVFALILVTAPLLPFEAPLGLLIVVVGAFQVLSKLVEGASAVFVAHEHTHVGAGFEAAFKLATAIAGIVAIAAGLGLTSVLTVVALTATVVATIPYVVMVARYGRPPLSPFGLPLRRVLRDAWPYAVFLLVFQVHSRVDVLSLGFLRGTDAAGVYNTAYRVIFLFSFVPQYMGTAILPRAARLFAESPRELARLYQRTVGLIVLVGVPSAAVLWWGAPTLVRVLYGSRFDASGPVLRLLSVLVVSMSLTRMLGTVLTSCDRQGARTRMQCVAAAVSVTLMLALVPRYGAMGAALGLVLSESLLAVLLAVELRPVLGWPVSLFGISSPRAGGPLGERVGTVSQRILILGQFFCGNLGDPAILAATKDTLAALGSYDIEAWPIKAQDFVGLRVRYSSSWFVRMAKLLTIGVPGYYIRLVRHVARTDLVMLGGGHIVLDHSVLSPVQFLLTCIIAKMLRKPVFICAVGAGPIRRRLSARLYRAAFLLADRISVRDEFSLRTAIDVIGCPASRVQLTADPAIATRPRPKAPRATGTIIGVSTIAYELPTHNLGGDRAKHDRYVRDMAALIDRLRQRPFTIVKLIPSDIPDDLETLDVIYQKLADTTHVRRSSPTTAEELIDHIAECDLLVGTRLHPSILALSQHVPVVGIVSQFTNRGKIGALFDVMDWRDLVFDIDTFRPEDVAAAVERVLAARGAYVDDLRRRIAPLQERAEENGLIAKALLDKDDGASTRDLRARTGVLSER